MAERVRNGAVLMPFSVACSTCGSSLAYARGPQPPDFIVRVSCAICDWHGAIELPRVQVLVVEDESSPMGHR